MANECVPYYEPGGNLTGECKGAVVGKRFLKLDASIDPGWQPEGLKSTAAPNVVPVLQAGAGEHSLGIAQQDKASGALVTILGVPGGVYPVTAGGAITPGATVQVGTGGKAVARTTGIAVGQALSKTTADGQTVAVRFLPAQGTDLGQ